MTTKGSGDMKKLLLVGVGAMLAYSQFGAVGLIVVGVVLLLTNN